MTCTSHPRWGRSVEECRLGSDTERVDLDLDAELGGIQALQTIAKLSSESYAVVQTDLEIEIGIPTIEAALLLSRDPRTISHLANPPVLKSCIRLMNTVQGLAATGVTPFSHEYGYLRFKLFVVVLNVCLLERWDKLEEVLTLCKDKELVAHVYISYMTASLVSKQVQVFKAGGECDWVFGWTIPTSGHHQPTLLPLSDISTLLILIWDDRKNFLLSHMSFTPKATGLSGLMFMFSRYIAHRRSNKESNVDWKLLQGKVYEIALRYALVADERQRRATVEVTDDEDIGDWYNTPKHIDTDDSRLILGAYIRTLTRDGEVHDTFHPPFMLRLVGLSISDSTQDLLPEVVRWTIEYGWRMLFILDNGEDNFEIFIQFFISVFSYLLRPPLDRPVQLIPSTQVKIIDVMRKKGLLDLLARVLIRLKPGTTYAELEANAGVQKSILLFVRGLAEVVPQRELERCFGQYAPEWWKVYRYFTTIPTGTSPQYRDHYAHCAHAWLTVAEFVGLEPGISEYGGKSGYNGEAIRSSGARFGCTGCVHAWYCDDHCKRMD